MRWITGITLDNYRAFKGAYSQAAAPIKLSVVECEVTEATKRKFTTLQLAFDQLWNERGNAAPTNNTAFHNHIKVSNNRYLIDLMTF